MSEPLTSVAEIVRDSRVMAAVKVEDLNIPEIIEVDDDERQQFRDAPTDRLPLSQQMPRTAARDDSGLRMIGSLGRDRAEASGELVPFGASPAPLSETQRELVTILPRRITREMQVVAVPAAEPAAAVAGDSPPVAVPRTRTPPPKLSTEGHGVAVRASQAPPAGALVMIGLAAILAGVAVFFWLRRPDSAPKSEPNAAVTADAAVALPPPLEAGATEAVDAGVPLAVDAAAPAVDAGDAAPVDPNTQARVLYQQAHDANQEGDFRKALELADASLALRRTARGFLIRAQALQRLGRVEEALQAVDQAQKLAPKYATVYEVRGNILWAARRWDAAHDAYNQFLELEQDTARAEQIRRRLEESH
jgi:hypothetical protein